MKPEIKKSEIKLDSERNIILETGKLAKQSDGSVVVKCGDCMLLATVVSSKHALDVDFLPLTVDYREKFASAGRFPGGFFKREARPSTEEILTMRLVDRVLRPLFPKDYHHETQIMIQLMSHDENVMPDSLAGLAASAAIQLSDIPFEEPISEVRVAQIGGKFYINPSKEQLESSNLDIIIGASNDSVTMVEGEFDEVSEEDMVDAIKFGHEAIKKQINAQLELVKKCGVLQKREYEKELVDKNLQKKVRDFVYDKCCAIAKKGLNKEQRSDSFSEIKDDLVNQFDATELDEKEDEILKYFSAVKKEAVREVVLSEGLRLDGRKFDEIRPIWCEVDYLPSTHGSSIFTRGETQALATVTLGTTREANIIDLPTNQGEESFYLHYNFPPFSTGEARPLRGTSRREVGHGNLAQRALKKVIPNNCPYTVRIVSEILESNGSSSMATVCAGSLALMDAGIQISDTVSGIAMGLITDGKRFAVLSDILGDEDHLGDMDFKVTGTSKGITACQMDIKIKGLSYEILTKALMQARKGRLHILKKIEETIAKPNNNVKNHAPKIIVERIPNEFIGPFIGTGGKAIQELQKETGTTIVINEDPLTEEGIVEILGVSQEGIDKVLVRIEALTFKPKYGETYEVQVIKVLDFGAVVEYTEAPGNEVLLHISEIAWERTENVSDVLKIGDVFDVKYFGIDKKTRKEKVSRKVLIEKPKGYDNKRRNFREKNEKK